MPPNKPDTRPSGAVHDSSLPQWAVDKMRHQRGHQFAFEDLQASQTALVIIDLMETYIAGTPCAASIIAPINRLASIMRSAGGLVVWVTPAPIAKDDRMLRALWGDARVRDMVAETSTGKSGAVWANGLLREACDVESRETCGQRVFPRQVHVA